MYVSIKAQSLREVKKDEESIDNLFMLFDKMAIIFASSYHILSCLDPGSWEDK